MTIIILIDLWVNSGKKHAWQYTFPEEVRMHAAPLLFALVLDVVLFISFIF